MIRSARARTYLGMSEEGKRVELFDAIDDLVDTQLKELKHKIDLSRAAIDNAASTLAAQLQKPDRSLVALENPAPAHNGVGNEAPAARIAPTPVVSDAPDFGDIAATIANDDDWKAL